MTGNGAADQPQGQAPEGQLATSASELRAADCASAPTPVAVPDRWERVQQGLARLQQVLDATLDADLRLHRVGRLSRDMEPDDLALLLEHTARRSIEGDLRGAYIALVHWILHARPRPKFPVGHWPLPDDELAPPGVQLALTVAAAVTLQCPFAATVLRGAFARVQPGDHALLPLHPSVEKWPLGVRRERARGTDKHLLPFLLLDTTPAVVQILASNPRIMEPQAVQIASLRSQHPWALQCLLMSPRWLGNGRVVEAVARSPSAPGWLVLLIAPLLPRRTQMALVHLHWIDREVREILADWHDLRIAEPVVAPVAGNIYEVDEAALQDAEELLRLAAELQGAQAPDAPAKAGKGD